MAWAWGSPVAAKPSERARARGPLISSIVTEDEMDDHHPSHNWSGGKCTRCLIAYMPCTCEPASGCARKLECLGQPHPVVSGDTP